jgi:hypothetical protein
VSLLAPDAISRGRATALLAALAALNIAFAAVLIVPSYVTLAVPGQLPDFAAFWAAGAMTLEGDAALAYDWEAHRAAEVAGLGRDFNGLMPWHYPPHVQMIVTPLGALPLFPAMILWVGGTLALFLWTCWRILPQANAVLAGLAAAPTALTLVNGQIGFLMAALLGLALLNLDRRPLRAGLLLGLLSLKPHLVVAVPVPLILAGRWKAVLGGAAMTLALAALSWVLLGGETWSAFIASITRTSGVFAGEKGKWTMYASLYGGLRFNGLGFTPALAVQGFAALAVLILTVKAWRNPATPAELRAALICFAAVVATPRVLSYDLHILVIGALFQMRHALRAGFFPGEQLLLALAALAAFLSMLAAPGANAALGVALLAGCWWGHLRRPRAERSTS